VAVSGKGGSLAYPAGYRDPHAIEGGGGRGTGLAHRRDHFDPLRLQGRI
jgi:hypothetical protein